MSWMYVLIALVAAGTSLLTFFSGFGVGTILTPVFALFFPVEVAVALTGIVHLLNNLFKLTLIGREIDRSVLLRFGVPALLGAVVGAGLLARLSGAEPLLTYTLWGRVCTVTSLKLVMSVLIFFFAGIELIPHLKAVQIGRRHLLAGGLLSGFFGGLSGHQGALRSAFLIRLGLSKESFVATGVAIACIVDFTRIPVYLFRFQHAGLEVHLPLLLTATGSAFVGAYFGRQLLRKVTFRLLQVVVSVAIMLIAVLLGLGVI